VIFEHDFLSNETHQGKDEEKKKKKKNPQKKLNTKMNHFSYYFPVG
jgi:hypothetical protein